MVDFREILEFLAFLAGFVALGVLIELLARWIALRSFRAEMRRLRDGMEG